MLRLGPAPVFGALQFSHPIDGISFLRKQMLVTRGLVAGRISIERERALADPKSHARGPLHGARIEDYCLIGDCETGALLSRDGSIDWLCWPSFSSGACFAALLGTKDNGYWRIVPKAKIRATARRYEEHTLIAETIFTTSSGEVMVTDFMPLRDSHSHVVRIVQGVRGRVAMRMDLVIRFDYGRTTPWVTRKGDTLRAIAGPDMVVLRTRAPLCGEGMTTVSEFSLRQGQRMVFTLSYCSSLEHLPLRLNIKRELAATRAYWNRWARRNRYKGQYAAAVERSLMTLKALTYRPSGGVVAAVTTSLPEQIGGQRNWDYRYCWLRDTAFTLLGLMQAGYVQEAVDWREWLLRAAAGTPDQIQTIYGLNGERELPERELNWLTGYRHSLPVRVGNAAVDQFQLDVYGEVAAALARAPRAERDLRVSTLSLQAALINHLCRVWRQPDQGIWETRGGQQHFTHSKVMAWVALDRAIKHFEKKDGDGSLDRWRRVRAQIHKEVCDKGFNRKLNSFVQAYGSSEMDASSLRIGLVGFLPFTDPRIHGTVDAIQKHLMKDGLVQRYNPRRTDDGLAGGEGTFLACSFWMVTNLWLMGRKSDARVLFERLLGLRNDVGLLSEEYHARRKRMLGNFPQALSHIALVHAAFAMSGMWQPEPDVGER
jgi:GH15 family glucan-1,4-alpha-glucosidase